MAPAKRKPTKHKPGSRVTRSASKPKPKPKRPTPTPSASTSKSRVGTSSARNGRKQATAASNTRSRKRPISGPSASVRRGPAAAPPPPPAEKRLRRWKPKAPKAWLVVYERAISQRFYVLSRTRYELPDGCPEETVGLAGTTGNVYHVCICRVPTCDCPAGAQGAQCKHVAYVLGRVLRAKREYVYQAALLSSELREILDAAPLPDEDGGGGGLSKTLTNQPRKPLAEQGDCPICFVGLVPGGTAAAAADQETVWCRAACGQNFHASCFESWAAIKRRDDGGSSQAVTCPLCRSTWEGNADVVCRVRQGNGRISDGGYENVADQLGIASTVRDTSSYSRWFLRSRR